MEKIDVHIITGGTTKKSPFYDTYSTTVVYNWFRKWYGDIFVIIVTKNAFYDAHFKTVIENRLKMLYELNFSPGFTEQPS